MTLQALESKTQPLTRRMAFRATKESLSHGIMDCNTFFCVAQMEGIGDTCRTLHVPSIADLCGRTHRDSTDTHFRTTPIVRQKQSNAQLSCRQRIASHYRPRLICLILRNTFFVITSILETISSGRDLFMVPSR